jgi:predicted esterase YcpF (UPF0227 family)
MHSEATHFIYLHGFLSSPESSKARETIEWCKHKGVAERLHVPELIDGPIAAITQVQSVIDSLDGQSAALIGSSLGGFYATILAERNGLRAVVINPAVSPYRYWRNYLGEHRNYHSGRIHRVTEQHVRELRELDPGDLKNPQNYLLLAQKGDEVLDYRLAVDCYRGGTCIIEPGGSHSFDNFASHLPRIFEFLAIKV